jgi:acetyl-CoA carboxylase biotin carboxylase subunit
LPGGPGVRIDSHVYPGYEVPPYYDPMLAKVIVWAPTRAEAIARMARALHELEITGVKTNTELQKKIIANPFYKRGEISTDFLLRRVMNNGSL